MIPVILGILLALFINDWKQGVDDEKFLGTVMDSINKEFKENQQDLTSSIRRHEILLDTISEYIDDDAVSVGQLIGMVSGVSGVNVKNTAWKAIVGSRIELVNYRKISLLTDIDQETDMMSIKLEKLLDQVFPRIGSTDYIDKEVFRIMISDLLNAEQELLELYLQFEEAYD